VDATLATWIIGGMAAGYAGMAAYIVKLHTQINQMLRERLKSAEDKLALIDRVNEDGGNAAGGKKP
jgi:hypothetical protein